MKYACLTRDSFKISPYEIVTLRHEDMQLIKGWRNDQIDVLRQHTLLTVTDQEQYWSEVVEPLFAMKTPRQVLFSYLLDGQCIGYGGLTHIDWTAKRAEVSFLLATERNKDLRLYHKEFLLFLTMLRDVAFVELDLHRLFTETYAIRPHVIFSLEAFGFLPEGRLKEHVNIKGKYIDAIIHGLLPRYIHLNIDDNGPS